MINSSKRLFHVFLVGSITTRPLILTTTHRFGLGFSYAVYFSKASVCSPSKNFGSNCKGWIETQTRRYCHTPAHHNNQTENDQDDGVPLQIKALCLEKKIDSAILLFQSHPTVQGAIEIIIYYIKERQDDSMDSVNSALQVYNFLIRSNLQLNTSLFSHLMDLCNKHGQFHTTLKLYSEFENNNLTIDIHIFSNVCFAVYRERDQAVAKMLLSVLNSGVDFKPNIFSCNHLLIVLNNFNDCFWLIGYILENQIEFDEGAFIEVFKLCSIKEPRAIECGQRVYSHLLQTPFMSNEKIINHILQMHAKQADIDQSIRVFETIDQPSWILWFCIIDLCIKNGQLIKASQLFDRMFKFNIKLNEETLLKLITTISNAGLKAIKLTGTIHQHIVHHKLDTNVKITTSLIHMYNKCGEPNKSIEVYDKMIENNITLDEVTFTNLLTAISDLGPNALEKGKQIHQQITQHKLDTDINIINTFIQMYDKCGKPSRAFELYDNMIKNNITPNEITFTNVLTAIFNLGPTAIKRAKRIHKHIIQYEFDSNFVIMNLVFQIYNKFDEPTKSV